MDITPVRKLGHIDQFLRTFTSENTRAAYEKDLKDYAVFAQNLDPFSFSALAQYRDALIASSAPATVVRKFSAVKSFFGFLASEGHLRINPAQNLKLPKARTIEPTEAFSDQEVVSLINAADVTGFAGSMHRFALILLFNLGLRRSELVNLRLSSVQEHRGTRFLSVVGKGEKQRLIPLSDLVIEELNSYLMRYSDFTGCAMQPNDYLIQSSPYERNAKPFNPSSVCRIVKQYAREAGITKRVSPHSCRATMISHLLEKQVSPRSVADLAGHSSIQTTVGIYDRKRDALSNTAAAKVNYGC
jgi:integrase/recombinase XerD